MTHKFKFGDRVMDKDTRLGECVVINASEKFVYVMNERGDYNVLARPETLEIEYQEAYGEIIPERTVSKIGLYCASVQIALYTASLYNRKKRYI